MPNSTERFSSRVENYIRYRPRYPQDVIEVLRDDCGLISTSVVADVGSGTGILSELFLTNGNTVIGVEPNAAMRRAAETLLAAEPRFQSVNGTAEHTGLPAECADFVTAGQAFHWFDRKETQGEFKRVLKPEGWVALTEFFTNGFSSRTLANSQHFDFDGLKGRLLSSSYAPEATHSRYEGMIAALRRVFDSHQQNGEVTFVYDTNLYYGRL